MILDMLCGRVSEPPSDPAHAGLLASLVTGELAHRVFLDVADVRIVEFTRQLHEQTGVEQHMLDAVLRGLLGASLPAVVDSQAPLLALGRGLVLELELNDEEVAELVARCDQQIPDMSATSTEPSNPQPSIPIALPDSQSFTVATLTVGREPVPPTAPVAPPNPRPPTVTTSTAGSESVSPTAPVAPRSSKMTYFVGGILATSGVLALVAGLILPLGAGGSDPLSDATTAPPESDPAQVTQAFAEAINNEQFDRARVLVCSGSSSMTRHIAQGQLPVQGFTVNRVETQNSTTAYVLAKATITSQRKPLAWRGTLHNRGGKWCILDLHPEDNSPPEQPETRSVAFEKMRSFITLVNQSGSVKAMTYVCGTRQRPFTQTIIDMAITTGARLTVRPDPGREDASTYTGSVTGRSPKLRQEIVGDVEISRGNNGTYCISNFQIRYE